MGAQPSGGLSGCSEGVNRGWIRGNGGSHKWQRSREGVRMKIARGVFMNFRVKFVKTCQTLRSPKFVILFLMKLDLTLLLTGMGVSRNTFLPGVRAGHFPPWCPTVTICGVTP